MTAFKVVWAAVIGGVVGVAAGPSFASEEREAPLPCNSLCRHWMGFPDEPAAAAPLAVTPTTTATPSTPAPQTPPRAVAAKPSVVPLPPLRSAEIRPHEKRSTARSQVAVVRSPAQAAAVAVPTVAPAAPVTSASAPETQPAAPSPFGAIGDAPHSIASSSADLVPEPLILAVAVDAPEPLPATAGPVSTANVVTPVVAPPVQATVAPPSEVAQATVAPAVPSRPTAAARVTWPPPLDVIGALILETPPLRKDTLVLGVARP